MSFYFNLYLPGVGLSIGFQCYLWGCYVVLLHWSNLVIASVLSIRVWIPMEKETPFGFGEETYLLWHYCMTGPQIRHALTVCNLVRDRYPHIPIIWGGVHASLLPEQTLENSLVDIVVVGEGEDTLPELIEAMRTKQPTKTGTRNCI